MEGGYITAESRLGCFEASVENPNPIWKSENVLQFYFPVSILVIFTIISISRFLQFALRPLNQPHFIAELLAGLLLCPEILGKGLSQFLLPLKGLLGIETLAHVGLIYSVFITGLEMDIGTVLLARKKATSIAILGIVIPFVLGYGLFYLDDKLVKIDFNHAPRHGNPSKACLFWAFSHSITSFPVLAHILSDLKVLYTGLGKVALTAATLIDFINWTFFVLLIPFTSHAKSAIFSFLGVVLFALFCYFVLRPYLGVLFEQKAEKHDWDNYQLSYVVLSVYACALVTEMLGAHSIVGALLYGLVIPRGKFTDLLIERSDDVVSVYLAPIFYASCGIRFSVTSVASKKHFIAVALIVLLSTVTKIISTVMATGFYNMSLRDSVALGSLMNTKGILPLIVLNIARDREIMSVDSYSTMVTSILVMTFLVPPIVNSIYKPKKRFEQDKLRTIQHLNGDADIRVMVCVHNFRQASGMISLLEASTAINASLLRIYSLQLIEQKGRATAYLAAHIDQTGAHHQQPTDFENNISTVFAEFATENNHTRLESLTAVSSLETIHKDIYNIAEEKQASLILLPFHKQATAEGILEIENSAFRVVNHNVIQHAPCSVGILVDRGHGPLSKINLRVAMVFVGGPDDREALAVAWRMSKHQGIYLTMVRILLEGKAAEVGIRTTDECQGLLSTVLDNEKQKELDDEYVSLFRLTAVNNEDSCTYIEKEVQTGDDFPKVLTELDQIGFDLYVLGQAKGRNSLVFSSLLEWTDCPELGVIGDMLASNSFGYSASLLVVQQYGFGGTQFKTNNAESSNEGASKNEDIEALFGKAE